MNWDETDGWIFSDEYHLWQDLHPISSYRMGGSTIVIEYGWYLGIYQVKGGDGISSEPDVDAASWPEPLGNHRIPGR